MSDKRNLFEDPSSSDEEPQAEAERKAAELRDPNGTPSPTKNSSSLRTSRNTSTT